MKHITFALLGLIFIQSIFADTVYENIDKNGNIRCRKDNYGNPILFYDGLEKEGVKAIQQDIAILLRE